MTIIFFSAATITSTDTNNVGTVVNNNKEKDNNNNVDKVNEKILSNQNIKRKSDNLFCPVSNKKIEI